MGQLGDLAQAIAACRERWGLTPDGALPGRYRHVEAVRMRDGTPAVLKVGPPEHPELDALEWFAGHGGVRVLAIDRERGGALMERVLPGTRLVDAGLDDEAATAAAAGVMAGLWRPPEGRFETVREWGEGLEGRPAAVYAELCDSMGEEVVLHGDLHHENILLSDTRGWVAIDPSGVVGEREYETGALMRNPMPVLHETRTLARRATQLAEALDLDGGRIRAWAWAQAHLAAAWSVEDGEDPAYWLAVAARLEPLIAR